MPAPEYIRTAIVDDEAPARALLREYLGEHADVDIVAECANGFEAVKTLGELGPDLVFLDIQMPKLDGFEVLELLAPIPAVVFCTAYDEHALRAFEVHAVDYLLKPFPRERLDEGLVRVRERLAAGGAREERNAAETAGRARAMAETARGEGSYLERVVVRSGAAVNVIPVGDIGMVEAQGDYIALHVGGKTHLKSQPLGELAKMLDPERFVRVHRSYVVPLDRIVRIEPYTKDSRVAVLEDGKQVPVSKSGYARLQELM
jgi:two-component system LytT family response regulator